MKQRSNPNVAELLQALAKKEKAWQTGPVLGQRLPGETYEECKRKVETLVAASKMLYVPPGFTEKLVEARCGVPERKFLLLEEWEECRKGVLEARKLRALLKTIAPLLKTIAPWPYELLTPEEHVRTICGERPILPPVIEVPEKVEVPERIEIPEKEILELPPYIPAVTSFIETAQKYWWVGLLGYLALRKS